MVRFEGLSLQIPPDKYRCQYVRVKVRVHRYPDGRLAVFHGPRKLAVYDAQGNLIDKKKQLHVFKRELHGRRIV
ncbi:MAG: hypothetical protein JRJ73_14650 [Deltaproteobacteria bacterium]|nr:hypothetical protein [Deltaproteobacteria bacterium]